MADGSGEQREATAVGTVDCGDGFKVKKWYLRRYPVDFFEFLSVSHSESSFKRFKMLCGRLKSAHEHRN